MPWDFLLCGQWPYWEQGGQAMQVRANLTSPTPIGWTVQCF